MIKFSQQKAVGKYCRVVLSHRTVVLFWHGHCLDTKWLCQQNRVPPCLLVTWSAEPGKSEGQLINFITQSITSIFPKSGTY